MRTILTAVVSLTALVSALLVMGRARPEELARNVVDEAGPRSGAMA